MTTSNKIIGISGLQRSGKDTLAEMLIQQGYFGVSLGDIVREQSRQRHKNSPDPISVNNMTETANWMRQQYGADVVLQKALEKFQNAAKDQEFKGLVLFSIRAPIEVDWILAHDGLLIWVDASDDTRYQRAMNALRSGEVVQTKEEYLAQEKQQWKPQNNIANKIQMNMPYVKKHATTILENDHGTIEQFFSKAQKLIDSFAK